MLSFAATSSAASLAQAGCRIATQARRPPHNRDLESDHTAPRSIARWRKFGPAAIAGLIPDSPPPAWRAFRREGSPPELRHGEPMPAAYAPWKHLPALRNRCRTAPAAGGDWARAGADLRFCVSGSTVPTGRRSPRSPLSGASPIVILTKLIGPAGWKRLPCRLTCLYASRAAADSRVSRVSARIRRSSQQATPRQGDEELPAP